MKHHITVFRTDGKRFSTAWDQNTVNGQIIITNQRTIEL